MTVAKFQLKVYPERAFWADYDLIEPAENVPGSEAYKATPFGFDHRPTLEFIRRKLGAHNVFVVSGEPGRRMHALISPYAVDWMRRDVTFQYAGEDMRSTILHKLYKARYE